MLVEGLVGSDRAPKHDAGLFHRRRDHLAVVGLFCKTLMEQIHVRAPGLEGRLHRWRGNGEIVKALRCLVDLEFAWHDRPDVSATSSYGSMICWTGITISSC